MIDVKEPNWGDWLESCRRDLDASRLLFEGRFYPEALYHLQQASEKLSKSLLLKLGIMTPRRAAEDWNVKEALGFLPKLPIDYGHRILPHLLSDADKAIPHLEALYSMVEKGGEFKSEIRNAKRTLRTSKAAVKRLRKQSPAILEDQKEHEVGVKWLNEMLDRIELVTEAMKEKAMELDPAKVASSAVKAVKRWGYDVKPEDVPPIGPVVEKQIGEIRMSVLCTVAVVMSSVLDPLESVTRYPKEKSNIFDESNPYVKEFRGWWALVRRVCESASSEADKSF